MLCISLYTDGDRFAEMLFSGLMDGLMGVRNLHTAHNPQKMYCNSKKNKTEDRLTYEDPVDHLSSAESKLKVFSTHWKKYIGQCIYDFNEIIYAFLFMRTSKVEVDCNINVVSWCPAKD